MEGHKLTGTSALLKRHSSSALQSRAPVSVVKHPAIRKITYGTTSPLSAQSISAKPLFSDSLSAVDIHCLAASSDTETDEEQKNGTAIDGEQLVRVVPAERDGERSGPIKSTLGDNLEYYERFHVGEKTERLSDSKRAGLDVSHSLDPSFDTEEQRAKQTASLLRGGTISQTGEQAGRSDLASEVLRLHDELAEARKATEDSQQAAAALQKAVDEGRGRVAFLEKEAQLARQAAKVSRQEADEAKTEVECLRGLLKELQKVVHAMKESSESQEEGTSQKGGRLSVELQDERQRREAAERTCIELQKVRSRCLSCAQHVNSSHPQIMCLSLLELCKGYAEVLMQCLVVCIINVRQRPFCHW